MCVFANKKLVYSSGDTKFRSSESIFIICGLRIFSLKKMMEVIQDLEERAVS